MDRLEAMSLVLAVAEAGSLSAAARRLSTPVATASRKIGELETHLGAKLFDRSARKLALTDTGLSYVAALKRILGDLSEAERAASGEYASPKGELVITAPVGLGRTHLVPVVAEFLRSHPDITLRLLLNDRVLSFPEDHIDVALRVGTLPDSSLIAVRLGVTHRVVCASPTYLAARGVPRMPKDIAKHDCISFEGYFSPNVWRFARGGEDFAVSVQPRLIVSTIETACEAASIGIGLTRAFSYHVQPFLAARALTTVLDDFRPTPLPINFVYASGRFLPIKLRAFLDFVTPRIKARIAES